MHGPDVTSSAPWELPPLAPTPRTAAAHREAAWKVRAAVGLCRSERQMRAMQHLAVLHEVVADRLESGELKVT